MACSSSPSSSSHSCNYDVFLSFRGEDTRKTFVDHLYTSLSNRMIFTYKDDETLAPGERIRSSLFNAIEGSRIAVIIFSKNYADSSWCLEELTHIMKCCKDEGKLTVIPIFYGVVPSDVRKQQGDFGRGFAKQADQAVGNINNKVEIWRKALVDACEIAGWETNTTANGHESKAIIEIVDKISNMLFPITSVVDEDLVGMRTRVQELEAQIEIGSDGVRMIGIWGLGGSGKTTLASYLSRKISRYFDGHCTLENIREESNEHGLKSLQKKIISRLLKKEMDVQDVDEGKSMISRLSRSNVLVILDDVDDIKQLDALAGSPHWFGNGSRIIITTRNKHLLTTHKVDHIYPIRLLSHDEAIQLFNKRAYNEKKPLKDYETLSQQVVSYTARLPLALKVLSSFMYDKDEKEWRSTLDRLKHTPHTEIFEQLKISYDGLESEEKELFLDIACFFRRWNNVNTSVIEVLEACGYHHDIGIKVLRDKALIAVVDGQLDMHDLIQEMGHYVVRKEYPNDPEKHSRVWKQEEIENMCRGDATTENDRTKGLQYICLHDGDLSLFCKYVSNMRKLRYLNVFTCDIEDKGPSFLSNELCYIEWWGYPRSLFPYSFKPIKLVTLKLYDSMQKKLWKGYKHLPNLKVLELVTMHNLHSTPNFDQLPSLQKLVLRNCKRLKKIHPSFGDHKSLEYVRVSSCNKLKMFPKIVQMENLKTLQLQFFPHHQVEFPVIKSNMRSLVEIYLEFMGIDALLSSIGERCTNLISVELKRCHLKNNEANFVGLRHLKKLGLSRLAYRNMPDQLVYIPGLNTNKVDSEKHIRPMLVFPQFAHLRKLNLGYCGLRDGEMPSDIGEIITLEELDLRGNDFTRLDFCLSQLTRLKVLILSHCEWLEELSQLPSGIIIFNADYCRSLTIVEDLYTNCKCLCDVSLLGMRITNDGYRLLESMLQGTTIENHCMVLRLQSHEIAKGFKPPLLRGRYYTLKLPEYWCNNFSGFLMCGVGSKSQTIHIRIRITVVKSGINHHNDVVWKESHDDEFHTCVWYLSFASLRHTEWWDETHQEVLFYIDDDEDSLFYDDNEDFESDQWSGFGVRLVAKNSGNGPAETSTPQEGHEFSLYTPNLEIKQDSQYALEFSFTPSQYSLSYQLFKYFLNV